jgi:2-methylisocitrate lyase-like PEP mutase family enzyme
MTQTERALLLKSLHKKGDPLILFNIWDAGSAKALTEIGAKAIATGSWSVAAAHGFSDGEELPFDLALANLKRIVKSVDVPVTLDLESGYGQVQENVTKVIQGGAVGINFEDQIIPGEGLYSIEDQSARIRTIREAAEDLSVPLFINARTDIFLKSENHTENHLDEAVRRAASYADAGASGFFAPGLAEPTFIEKLCELCPLPVNIMMFPGLPSTRQLAELGVARVSYGPIPYRLAMDALKEAGRKTLSMS